VIDLHSHVLPAIDDGAADLEEAMAICAAAAADGIQVLAATPHVRQDYPTTAEQMEVTLAELRAAVGDTLRLVPGGELDLAELDRPVEELRRFALAGNPEYLLVETPYYGWPLDLGEKLFRLRSAGITPVLAHPERNSEVQSTPDLLDPIVAGGTLVQLTAASIDGRVGRRARTCSTTLLERELAHLIASDAHGPQIREIGLAAAAREVGDEDLARWLTEGVPRAILERSVLPPRPGASRSRRRWFSGTRL
jgi:protein-tyrosine phosphatase